LWFWKEFNRFLDNKRVKSKNIVIAVPSLSLIKQTLDVYLGQIVARKEKVNGCAFVQMMELGNLMM
jgi:hypothetical protein